MNGELLEQAEWYGVPDTALLELMSRKKRGEVIFFENTSYHFVGSDEEKLDAACALQELAFSGSLISCEASIRALVAAYRLFTVRTVPPFSLK